MPKVSNDYKERLKRRILAAAFKEFIKRGYHKTNLDDVAKSLKIARGTIYLYFRSKREIFETLSELQLSYLRELLERHDWTSGDIAATAKAFYLESKEGLPQNNERMAIELLAESTRSKELKRQRLLEFRKMQEIIVEVFQSQVREGITTTEIREVALGSIALYNGLQILKALGYSDEELQNSWARILSLMLSDGFRDFRKIPAVNKVNLIQHTR
ncbi:MAG: TetR/AcrR family transcriptional regulator [Nitrososphaerota archaeon]|nr:TetR/AcrR family transcriptional regulator [Nitrososphaerota archaeon]